MKTVTEIIKSLRELGLSQSEISRRTGIPQPRISRWEAGEVPAGADDALKLQQLLAAPKARAKATLAAADAKAA